MDRALTGPLHHPLQQTSPAEATDLIFQRFSISKLHGENQEILIKPTTARILGSPNGPGIALMHAYHPVGRRTLFSPPMLLTRNTWFSSQSRATSSLSADVCIAIESSSHWQRTKH